MDNSNLTEYQLLYDLSEYYSQITAKRVIKSLQSLRRNCLLSGNESGLETTWDEICVQVQTELSIYWDVYVETIRNCIRIELFEQFHEVQNLLAYTGNKDCNNINDCNVDFAIKQIYTEFIPLTDNYNSKRAKRYLNVG